MIEIAKDCIGDIKPMPLIPDGSAFVTEVMKIEVRTKKLCDSPIPGATYLNLQLQVVDPEAKEFNGEIGFYSVGITNSVNKALCLAKANAGGKDAEAPAILEEYKKLEGKSAKDLDTSKGYLFIGDQLDAFYVAFNLEPGPFDETKLIGKKVIAVFGQREWQGKKQSNIDSLQKYKG